MYQVRWDILIASAPSDPSICRTFNNASNLLKDLENPTILFSQPSSSFDWEQCNIAFPPISTVSYSLEIFLHYPRVDDVSTRYQFAAGSPRHCPTVTGLYPLLNNPSSIYSTST